MPLAELVKWVIIYLYQSGMEEMEGVQEIIVPLSWDYENMFFEHKIEV